MRKKIVAGNWKMNLSLHEADVLLSQILEMKEDYPGDVEVIVAPPAIYLSRFYKQLKASGGVALSAQNCAYEQEGAFTGEVSAEMYRSVGVDYVILGHSERRNLFFEDDAVLARKVSAALQYQLRPIFCVGEQLEDRQAERQNAVVKKQLENAIFQLEPQWFQKLVLAYEPVWAIGTGHTASPEQVQEMHHFIRQTISGHYGTEIGESIRILYGGSVKPDNAKSLFGQSDVDGGLIGGASLKAHSFSAIIKAAHPS